MKLYEANIDSQEQQELNNQRISRMEALPFRSIMCCGWSGREIWVLSCLELFWIELPHGSKPLKSMDVDDNLMFDKEWQEYNNQRISRMGTLPSRSIMSWGWRGREIWVLLCLELFWIESPHGSVLLYSTHEKQRWQIWVTKSLSHHSFSKLAQ